jgi:TonB family protein
MLLNTNHLSFVVIVLFSVLAAHGQTQPPESTDLGNTAPASVFKVGGRVSAPKVIYAPDPEYSKEAIAENYGGTCILWMVVGPDGKPRNIRVVRTLGLGLDEKAIEAVKNWRFAPAMMDGKPVAVQINVDVNFHSHGKELNTRFLELENKANAGDPKAQLELSRAYFEGRDIPQNDVFGLELLERAANQGLAQAQFLMGEHAYADARREDPQGARSSADYVKAYTWYELALRGGYKQSKKMLKELAPKMSPEQLSDAKTRVDNWPNAPAK